MSEVICIPRWTGKVKTDEGCEKLDLHRWVWWKDEDSGEKVSVMSVTSFLNPSQMPGNWQGTFSFYDPLSFDYSVSVSDGTIDYIDGYGISYTSPFIDVDPQYVSPLQTIYVKQLVFTFRRGLSVNELQVNLKIKADIS
ncbi:MAG: hypothetical protein RBR77_04190 [Thauera sp.]|jgi:hypothetical protein|nr:hypothetical protein [Thauera sp.]